MLGHLGSNSVESVLIMLYEEYVESKDEGMLRAIEVIRTKQKELGAKAREEVRDCMIQQASVSLGPGAAALSSLKSIFGELPPRDEAVEEYRESQCPSCGCISTRVTGEKGSPTGGSQTLLCKGCDHVWTVVKKSESKAEAEDDSTGS